MREREVSPEKKIRHKPDLIFASDHDGLECFGFRVTPQTDRERRAHVRQALVDMNRMLTSIVINAGKRAGADHDPREVRKPRQLKLVRDLGRAGFRCLPFKAGLKTPPEERRQIRSAMIELLRLLSRTPVGR